MFPKSRLTQIFQRSPRLSALLFRALAQEESKLIERIINLGYRTASQRLAHFIVEMKLRLHQSSGDFALPMNQAFIGDTLGLSAVHVSRTLKCLRNSGWVNVEAGVVHIADLDALIAYAEYNPAYLGREFPWARRANWPAGAQVYGTRARVVNHAPQAQQTG